MFHVDKPRAMVWYCDTRRLGRINWYPMTRSGRAAFAGSHGPDALEISRQELARRLSRTARGIKPALMDQKVLAGIGNIYADEVFTTLGFTPNGWPDSLNARELGRLHRAIGEIWRPRSRWRARASMPGIELFSVWKAASWRRTRFTGGKAAVPEVFGADHQDQDRRPDRPADVLLCEVSEGCEIDEKTQAGSGNGLLSRSWRRRNRA